MKTQSIFSEQYPHIAEWVMEHGWIEIGDDDSLSGFVRALNMGGLVWESSIEYAALEDALKDLDAGLADWIEENG